MPRKGFKSLTLYGTAYDLFMAKMREAGFNSPSAFVEFMLLRSLPRTQGVVGSNPTQSTNLFALDGKKLDQKPSGFIRPNHPESKERREGTIVPYDGGQINDYLKSFKEFLIVDLGLQPLTVKEHSRYVRLFLETGFPHSKEGIRAFLAMYKGNPASKANAVKA
ncbi:MAG: hypothetical protein ABC559_06180, partial [Candidatus Methanosuratincola petrocarbonis]